MEKHFNELCRIFKSNNFDDITLNSVDDAKLLYLYAFYHYGDGNEDNLIDVSDRCKYTRVDNNFAYGFFETDEEEEKTFDLLTSYYVKQGDNFKIETAEYMIMNIEMVLQQLKNKFIPLSAKESKLLEFWEQKDANNILIKILTNYIPATKKDKEELLEGIKNTSHILRNTAVTIIFGDDIIEEIESISVPREHVEKGYFILEKENNYLVYGKEKSLITNVTAKSLKDNYKQYGKTGLFAMNLRFYIKNAKVDSGLELSIKEKGDIFWYLNNGIIIVCDDYKIKNNIIHLKNYSIVNGGQTTRMIGETDFESDFSISCKIIKNTYQDKRAKYGFVSEIAAASNTQKPIKATDIIANRVEQRLLKSQLEGANIFVQIKRGELPINPKENYPEPWQKTKNEEIAQLVYSGIYQKPGVSRNNKESLFSNKEKYNTIFGETYETLLLKDLLFIRSYYKKWQKKVQDEEKLVTEDTNTIEYSRIRQGLVKNGLFYTVSMIMLLAKLYFSPQLLKEISSNDDNFEKVKYLYSQNSFDHRIFSKDYSALSVDIFRLFEYVLSKYFIPAFQMAREYKPDLAYSNYTKMDNSYSFIAKQIIQDFEREDKSERLTEIIDNSIYIPTAADHKRSEELFSFFFDKFKEGKPYFPVKSADTSIDKDLDEALNEFRTYVFNSKKYIKAYHIFTNKEKENIVLHKPRTLEELIDSKSLFKDVDRKIEKYGNQIVAIVNKVMENHNL